MTYNNIKMGRFLSRPNRFIAHCEIDGVVHVCHVKNTGRCGELLVPGATVVLDESDNPNRKTRYDLVSVYKGERLINMDSQAPNKVFSEYIPILFPTATFIKPEYTIGSSRLDFYIEASGLRHLVEVKGVTLEQGGYVRFPDAPTERGVKHIHHLLGSIAKGFTPHLVFIVQMSGVLGLSPNDITHPAFGNALRAAASQGVNILAFECSVTPSQVAVVKPVPVIL